MIKTFLTFLLLIPYQNMLHAQDLLIKGGSYFNISNNSFVENKGIKVISGKIVAIGGEMNTDHLPVLNLDDSFFILPGIIDLHAHYKVHIGGKEKTDTLGMPIIYLANGVTSSFTAGELEPKKILELKRKIENQYVVGPRIFNTGPYFGKDANSKNNAWKENLSEEQIEELIDHWASKGIAGVKVKGITEQQLKTIIERAHFHGLTVTGHLDSGYKNTVSTEIAIKLGIDRVEHFLGGTVLPDTIGAYSSLAKMNPYDIRLDTIIQKFIENRIYYSPTLSTYGMVGGSTDEALADWIDQSIFFTSYAKSVIEKQAKGSSFQVMMNDIYENKKIEIKRFYDAGGKDLIVLGTDRQLRNGDIGGFAAHKEMRVLSEVGIPNHDVIGIASINGARALGVEDELGSIEIGKWADLYVVQGNPIKDISNTSSVFKVIKGGIVYDSEALLNSVHHSLGPKNAEDWQNE
ncbi:amidohydrolase family protein [Namhaeicola litoreus]|uniref:Amidohydrolase family protein n=1 Tax=Namhaeicola litoreus TaxID=1052145 RepID=A0ABW3XXK3_9FLAO